MESPFTGFVLDPSKCSKLNMEEKRELVYQISKCPESAPAMLQTWSRRELSQILCAEMGKERKYTGLTKIKMIQYLLKVMSKRDLLNHNCGADGIGHQSNGQTPLKRQRKAEHPVRVVIPTNIYTNENQNLDSYAYCQNLACKAALKSGAVFCKRCSCCICYNYDDNKDPSLWLVCSSEPPNEGESCGMSCHLECALKHERSGIAKDGPYPRLDGSFYCVTCQKANDLLRCWRKQLVIAKETRRVDTLCHRIFLSQKLLNGTKKYQNLQEIVNTVSKKLEAEVGALDGLPVKNSRGIVNRLSCGPEVQNLCASAVGILDTILSGDSQSIPVPHNEDMTVVSPGIISFEDVSPTSLTIVLGCKEDALSKVCVSYALWHRRADNGNYPIKPTAALLKPNSCFSLMDLIPGTDYMFKVVSFDNGRELDKWEARLTTADVMKGLSNPSSDADDSHSGYGDQNHSPQSVSDYKTENPSSSTKSADRPYACEDINHFPHKPEASDQKVPGDSVSVLDEGVVRGIGSAPNSAIQTESQRDSTYSSDENQASDIPKSMNKTNPESQLLEEMSIDNESNANPVAKSLLGRSDSVLPMTPSKQEKGKDGPTGNREKWSLEAEEPQAGSSSRKRRKEMLEEAHVQDGSLERDYEYCVKVIRWLECEGHIEKNFRVKFLTWFSLRATPQERRIVSIYVDTLMDEPASLAGQLVDTFSVCVCSKRPTAAPTGFCMKLWH